LLCTVLGLYFIYINNSAVRASLTIYISKIIVQRIEPHNALATISQSVFSILPFALSTSLPKQSSQSSDLLPILPLCHNQTILSLRQLHK
jgi:uncharacterized membrane protein